MRGPFANGLIDGSETGEPPSKFATIKIPAIVEQDYRAVNRITDHDDGFPVAP